MKGIERYILGPDGRTPVPEPDLLTWGEWFEQSGETRRVAKTQIGNLGIISTVFLGLDHQFRDGPPILFETKSFFVADEDDYFDRYSTWSEAEAGHARIVQAAFAALEAASVAIADAMVDRESR